MTLEYIIIFLFCFIVFHLLFDVFIDSYKGKKSLAMLRYSIRDKSLTTNIALGIFAGSTISMIVSSGTSAFVINFTTAVISFTAMIHENYMKKSIK